MFEREPPRKFPRATQVAAGPTQPPAEVNAGTRICCMNGVFTGQPLQGPLALARYEVALRAAASAHGPEHVFVAYADRSGIPGRTGVLAPGEAAVFGRHTQAQLEHGSPDLSLRHLAIGVAPSSTKDAPLLRVWDLATGRPFSTEDGLSTEALTADGPVFVTLGSVHLAAVPLSCLPRSLPLGTRALWESLPKRDVISRVAEGSGAQPLPRAGSDLQGCSRETRITRMPAARPPIGCPIELAVAELTLTSAEDTRSYPISADALERGILIGRYDRCLDIRGDLNAVSRVHLLITQIGRDIVAIDTASTYGSLKRGLGAFETTTLTDGDALQLANVLVVGWRAAKRGAA